MCVIKNLNISCKQAEGLLVLVILARSTSFVMTKTGLQDIEPFTLLGFRFLLAFLVLVMIGGSRLRGTDKVTVLRGILLGGVFFGVMAAEGTGLKKADASTAAFLENMAIVFVPLIEALLKRRIPRLPVIISILFCLGGLALLTLKGGSFSLTKGELLCLLAAGLYACAIILTDRLSKQNDPLALGMIQVGVMGVCSMTAAFLFETPHLPRTASIWTVIFGLAIICSVFGFTLQPFAQSRTNAERTSLFCALGPVGATVCGIVFLGERLEMTGLAGVILILLGMCYSYIHHHFFSRRIIAYET